MAAMVPAQRDGADGADGADGNGTLHFVDISISTAKPSLARVTPLAAGPAGSAAMAAGLLATASCIKAKAFIA